MPTLRAEAVFNRIIKLVAAQDLEERSDAELVERYAHHREQAAFEMLLRRHGPMILRLSRRLTANESDAEDIFQATFLVFARKATSIKKSASLGSWLFGVAIKLAAKSRTATERRRAKSAGIPLPALSADPLSSLTVVEAERILHEELARLPSKFRDPLVLCHLEGKTRDEAARALGCALGTLKDRLLRGKEMLRVRLTRRGIGLPAAMVASLLSETVGGAAVSETLARTIIQSANGAAEISAPVTAMVDWSIRGIGIGMAKAKLTAGLMAATVLMGGIVGLAALGPAVQPANINAAMPIAAADEKAPVKETEPKPKRVDALGDPLPDGAVMRLGTRRHRVQNWPLAWQSLPDGKSYLAMQRTGSATEIRRIDYQSGLVLEKWPIPDRFDAAGFSRDGRYVLLTSQFIHFSGLRLQGQEEPKQECILTLYDLAKREEVWTNRKKLAHNDWINIDLCSFSLNEKWILTAGNYEQSSVRLWDAATGAELWQRKPGGQGFQLRGFGDNHKLVVLRGANDGDIYLVDRATGKDLRSFKTLPLAEFPDSRLSPDGQFLLLAGYTSNPRIWDLMGKEQKALDGHVKWARENTFSPDGKTFFTGGSDDFVLQRDWPSGRVRRKIALGRAGVEQMKVSSDGKRLEVMFWGEQELAFFDLKTGKPLPPPIDSHRSDVYGIGTAPDGSLVTFGRDASVRTWDLKSGKTTDQLKVEMDLNAKGFALSADGRFIAVPKGNIDGIHVYDRASKKLLRTIPAKRWSMKQLMFSPDGKWLTAIDSGDGIVQVWDASTGKLMFEHKVARVIYGVAGAFSPDGSTFAFSEHGVIRFFDTATWKEQPEWEKVYAPLGLAYSPDGRTLAAASVEGVRLFEVATRRERVHVRPSGYPSGNVCFSPDGRFVTWSADRVWIHTYDIWNSALLGPITGHDDAITGLTFNKDGRWLASSSGDSTILLWDVAAAAKNASQDSSIDNAWQALAGDDAKAAFEAIRTLAANRDKTLKRIGERIKPAEPLDADWLAVRLKNLDSAVFAERERATRDLEGLGEGIVPHLEKFLKGQVSAESRQRAERIIKQVRGPAGESERALQMRRALEVLERIGGDESAVSLLEILAKGAEGAPLTRDAKATLERLKR